MQRMVRAAVTAGIALAASAPARDVDAPIKTLAGTPVIADASLSTAQRAAVEAVVRAEMKRRAIPGLQLTIVRHRQIAFAGAYGIADVETGVPVTADSLFTLNSSTKSFTGVRGLVVSGYAEAEGIEPGLPRLTKPFRHADLAKSLAALG